jgi:radical SAM protein with 4Fe4S-binding SPASM domain
MKRIREKGRVPLIPALPLEAPFVINIDPASTCNFKCNFCYHSNPSKMTKKGIMSWSTYKTTLNGIRLFKSKVKTLRFYAFGEPLLNPKLPNMIALAKAYDVCEDIDMTTNGSLFTTDLSQKIIKAGIDRINISVNGVTSDQYKQFTKSNIDFDAYVKNLTELFSMKENCTIFIKINGDVISEDDQKKFIDIFTPISDGCALEHVMNCWYDFDMEIETNASIGVYGQPFTHVDVCPYIFYSFCIQYDGVVSACFLDWNRKLVVGNVHDNNTRNIWHGGAMRNLRRFMLLKKRSEHPICHNCNQLEAGAPENLDAVTDDLLRRYKLK